MSYIHAPCDEARRNYKTINYSAAIDLQKISFSKGNFLSHKVGLFDLVKPIPLMFRFGGDSKDLLGT